MSKAKKATAAALAALALGSVPAVTAAAGSNQPVHVACQGGGNGGCSG